MPGSMPDFVCSPVPGADYTPTSVPQVGRIRQVPPPHDLQPVETFFGRRMHELRTIAKLSQVELAEKAGLHSTYISELERGFKRPSLDVVGRLLDALRVTFAEFFLPCARPYTTTKEATAGGGKKKGAGKKASGEGRRSKKSA